MRKKTTLALILMMNLACAMAQKSGTTGPLSWNYNETSKELTITGNGAMPNYDYGAAPWQEYQEGIETVIGQYKKEHNMPILQAKRYEDLLARRAEQAVQLGMDREFMRSVLQAIHEESIRQQMQVLCE